MKYLKRILLLWLLTAYINAFGNGCQLSDTCLLNVRSIDTTDFPVQLIYQDSGATRFVKGRQVRKGWYRFAVPVNGYNKAEIMIQSPFSVLMAGGGFMPQPMPAVLLGAGKEVNVMADFKNQLHITVQSRDGEIKLFEKIAKQERQFNDQSWQKIKERAATVSDERKKEIEGGLAAIRRKLYNARLSFVNQHKNSFAALMVFDTYYQSLNTKDAFNRLQSIARPYRKSFLWTSLFNKLTAASNTDAGRKVVEFSGTDINGNSFRSTDLKGRYYLVDFWGSWCVPCRQSHVKLKELYRQYHSRGFEIVGIAYESGTNEAQQAAWRKAVKEDDLAWINLLNTEQNNLVKQFGVSSFPTKLLVSPEEKIILRTNGSEELEKCLDSLMNVPVSLNKAVTKDSLMNYLNGLLKENSTAAREKLLREAAVLSSRNSEEDLSLAMKIYAVTDDSAIAAQLQKKIVEKYPLGLTARDIAYAEIFGAGNSPDLAGREAAYNKWIKKFPPSNFSAQQQGKYNFALLDFVQEYSKKNNPSKVDAYLKLLSDTSMRTVALYNAGEDFLGKDSIHRAESYLTEALMLSNMARSSTNMKSQSSFGALLYGNIVAAYAKLLLQKRAPDSVIALLRPLLKDDRFSGMNAESLTVTMARALDSKGEKQEAFSLLNNFLIHNTNSKEATELIRPLYLATHPHSEFSEYETALSADRQTFLRQQLAKEIISEKAPSFSLMDMDGRLLKLSDYRGKIVVIDFWATWCVPCVKSFPAMKRLTDRYKDNKDVVFLFINTWESNPDYKSLVKQLIQQNNYPFTVLYDDNEKKERSESVAAKFNVGSLPAKFIIDKNGNTRFQIKGAMSGGRPEEETLSAMIEMLLPDK